MQDNRRKNGDRLDIEIDVDLGSYGQYELSKLENVSAGGAFVKSKTLLDVGTIIKLKFTLPNEETPIHAEGEVVWAYDQRGRTDINVSGMGIRFTEIIQEDRDRIRKFIQNKLAS